VVAFGQGKFICVKENLKSVQGNTSMVIRDKRHSVATKYEINLDTR
jgi:hypothetical protein